MKMKNGLAGMLLVTMVVVSVLVGCATEAVTYTVTYVANEGEGTISPSLKTEGTALTLSGGAEFTRTGYVLSEWNTAANGSGTSYALSGTYSAEADVTLYAQWGMPSRYILRDGTTEAWGGTLNQDAIEAALGAAPVLYGYDVDLDLLTADNTLIFIDGGNDQANEMESFLSSTNREKLETWVSGGGVLFINSGPNEGDGMSLGFNTTTLNRGNSSVANLTDDFYNTLNDGSFLPVPQQYIGSAFSSGIVTGTALTNLITSDNPATIILAEKEWGSGLVMFGGITSMYYIGIDDGSGSYISPNGENQNLFKSIFEYLKDWNSL